MARVLQPSRFRRCSLTLSIHKTSILIFTFLVASAAIPAAAQTPPVPNVDLSLGYQTLHIPGQNYPLGIAVGVSGAVNSMVRIVAEAGISIDQQSATGLNGTLTLYHYGVGPRITGTAGRAQPYAQVLAGGVHTRADLTTTTGLSSSASDNAFMLQPGAGVIVALTGTFGAVGEVDYRRVFFKEGGDNEVRVFVGIRIAFR
jgi:hypothetical protein